MTALQADVAALKELVKLAHIHDENVALGLPYAVCQPSMRKVSAAACEAIPAIERLLGIVEAAKLVFDVRDVFLHESDCDKYVGTPDGIYGDDERPCTCGSDSLKALLDREK